MAGHIRAGQTELNNPRNTASPRHGRIQHAEVRRKSFETCLPSAASGAPGFMAGAAVVIEESLAIFKLSGRDEQEGNAAKIIPAPPPTLLPYWLARNKRRTCLKPGAAGSDSLDLRVRDGAHFADSVRAPRAKAWMPQVELRPKRPLQIDPLLNTFR